MDKAVCSISALPSLVPVWRSSWSACSAGRRSGSSRSSKADGPQRRIEQPVPSHPMKATEEYMRADIVPGARFPDYELIDQDKQRRRLSQIQGNDPMIVLLARGHYCPKDHQQHLELAVAYTKIVTISTAPVLVSRESR